MSVTGTKNLLPEGLLANFYSIYSPAVVDSIIRAYIKSRKTTLRINHLRGVQREIENELRENGIKYTRLSWYPFGIIVKNAKEREINKLSCYEDGQVYLQNPSSMIPPLFLELAPGLRILDMCAAPGSKTTQMADLIDNKGYILANEPNQIRAERLKHNVLKMGASCVEVRLGDGRDLGDLFKEDFDRVLIDAPCSGEGIIQIHNYSSFKSWSTTSIYRVSKLQRELLSSGRKALKKGGLLVYSTCTISAEENEEVIDWFINQYKDIKIMEVRMELHNAIPAIKKYKGKQYHEAVSKGLRIIPTEEMEGFFICKMKKE